MIRRLLTIASAISMLLCVGLAIEAVRGCSWSDALTIPTSSGTFQFTSCYGTLNFAVTRCKVIGYPQGWGSWQVRPHDSVWGWYRPDWFVVSSETRRLGIGYITGWNQWGVDERADGTWPRVPARLLSLPSWMPPLLAALLPAWWSPRAWRFRRGLRRRARGECDACGYSLAGNTSGICPECGTAIPDKVNA